MEHPHLFVHMLQKFCIFSGHLPEHQGCFLSDIPDTPRTCITVGIFISDISDIQQLIYLCTFSWCSGSSAFFQGICASTRDVFLPIFRTLPGQIYFGYLGHSAAHWLVHILRVLRKFRIFFKTFTWALGLFFSDILDTPRTCIAFDMFISDISDIQQLFYLCTFSGRSAFLQEMCPSTRVVFFFFRIFRTLQRPVLHLTYLFDIFWIFSTSLICACSGSSAFFSGHLPEHQGCFLRIFRTLQGHVSHLVY